MAVGTLDVDLIDSIFSCLGGAWSDGHSIWHGCCVGMLAGDVLAGDVLAGLVGHGASVGILVGDVS